MVARRKARSEIPPAPATDLSEPGPPIATELAVEPLDDKSIEEELEAMVEHANAIAPATPGQARAAGPKPWTGDPTMGRFSGIITTIVDEVEALDVAGEYAELERELSIAEALTPQVLKLHQNLVDKRAYRAHRLYVIAKVQRERFEVECDTALGAMRDRATAALQKEKDAGSRSKQITDRDVADKAATLYPDEWRDINDRLVQGKAGVDNLANLAARWERRSWTLSSMVGG